MKLILDFDGRRLQGARPFAVFESNRGAWKWTADSDFPFQNGKGDVLAEIRRALHWSREKRSTPGAAMGFFSYDFARQLEPRAFGKNSSQDDLEIPDVRLVFCDELDISPVPDFPFGPFAPADSGEIPTPEYSDSIARIREYIGAGDIYQANFATRFSASLPCSPEELYARLRSIHPAPFSALLEWDDFSIVSNSPERFLRLDNQGENGVLSSQPIKGTARRGSTPAEDQAIKAALQNSPKNRAENVMIVDLIRNDFGRVCQYGSIAVPNLFELQTFASLHHLVSEVRGVLRPDCDALDAFGAAFPCGSITGAPKIRAMQIIDELETTRRGASFGAVGYFGFGGDLQGDMEWNVAIRTITCKDGMAHFHVGGGIVEGSSAEDEYSEMQLKAAALRAALAEENRD